MTHSVSTTEVLAGRALGRTAGQECIDWAIGMLERGFESRSLLMLAGLSPPLNSFETSELRDHALEELQPPELAIDDPVTAFAAEMVREGLANQRSLPDVFAQVTRLAIALGYPSTLMPFYLLHFACEDLRCSEVQWYWKDATRENIGRIMEEEARRFLGD